ncbi:MAG: hypothetical protein AB1505_18030 [Candidatus Latescibacterota bacterium]
MARAAARANSAAGAVAASRQPGILVEAASHHRVDLPSRAEAWTGHADTLRLSAEQRTRMRQFHRLVVPALASRLGQSPHVRWAIDRGRPALQPDLRLFVEVTRLAYGSTLMGEVALPGASLAIAVVLEELPGHLLLHRERVQVRCTMGHEVATLAGLRSEVPACAAAQIAGRVGEVLRRGDHHAGFRD